MRTSRLGLAPKENRITDKLILSLIVYLILQISLVIFEVIGVLKINETILVETIIFQVGKLTVITGAIFLLSFFFFNKYKAFAFISISVLLIRVFYDVIAFFVSNYILGTGSIILLLSWYVLLFIALQILGGWITETKKIEHFVKSILFVICYILLTNIGFIFVRILLKLFT